MVVNRKLLPKEDRGSPAREIVLVARLLFCGFFIGVYLVLHPPGGLAKALQHKIERPRPRSGAVSGKILGSMQHSAHRAPATI
jgi:hypothetical protein